MSDKQYTAEELQGLDLENLRELQKSLGMDPGEKQEKRLRAEILEAQVKAVTPEASEASAPEGEATETQGEQEKGSTTPPVDSEAEEPTEEPSETAPEGEGIPSLDVNKFSSRLELETAGIALGIDEKKLAAAGSQEALWKLVKNAYLAKKTVVSVDEDNGEGELMKINVKHSGEFYKKGQRYVLGEDLVEEFRAKFYI